VANDRIRLGIIGPGDRGTQIIREALACPNTEFVLIADIYSKRLEDARAIAPGAKTYLDYRHRLDDKASTRSSSPRRNTMPRPCARRANAPADARCRSGPQGCSSGQVRYAVNFLKTGSVGKITSIHAHMYRNTRQGKAMQRWQGRLSGPATAA
jgi:predicted dehydrogenase